MTSTSHLQQISQDLLLFDALSLVVCGLQPLRGHLPGEAVELCHLAGELPQPREVSLALGALLRLGRVLDRRPAP